MKATKKVKTEIGKMKVGDDIEKRIEGMASVVHFCTIGEGVSIKKRPQYGTELNSVHEYLSQKYSAIYDENGKEFSNDDFWREVKANKANGIKWI